MRVKRRKPTALPDRGEPAGRALKTIKFPREGGFRRIETPRGNILIRADKFGDIEICPEYPDTEDLYLNNPNESGPAKVGRRFIISVESVPF